MTEVYAPRIEGTYEVRGEWTHRAVTVPWDVRLDQNWLRMYPKSWEPVS
jgi:hypothetical protein